MLYQNFFLYLMCNHLFLNFINSFFSIILYISVCNCQYHTRRKRSRPSYVQMLRGQSARKQQKEQQQCDQYVFQSPQPKSTFANWLTINQRNIFAIKDSFSIGDGLNKKVCVQNNWIMSNYGKFTHFSDKFIS